MSKFNDDSRRGPLGPFLIRLSGYDATRVVRRFRSEVEAEKENAALSQAEPFKAEAEPGTLSPARSNAKVSGER